MKFRRNIMLWLRNTWRIIRFSSRRYGRDQLGQQAIVLTYYTLFSIVPFIALVFGISRGFGLNFPLRDILLERFSAHREMLLYVCELAEWTLKESSGGVVAGIGIITLLWSVVWLSESLTRR